MDLGKIEVRKKNFLKAPDFATLKHLSLFILWYQSSPSRAQAELLTILSMRSCFEKNRAVKDFDIKQKNQFEKKIGDHLELRALAFNSGWSAIFLNTEKSHFMFVILSPCVLTVINH